MRFLSFLIALLLLVACAGQAAPETPATRGQRLFTIYCSGCHSETAHGLGPDLAEMRQRAASNSKGLSPAEWLRQATINPEAEVAPGYQNNLMPRDYGTSLTSDEIDALVAYMLSENSE